MPGVQAAAVAAAGCRQPSLARLHTGMHSECITMLSPVAVDELVDEQRDSDDGQKHQHPASSQHRDEATMH